MRMLYFWLIGVVTASMLQAQNLYNWNGGPLEKSKLATQNYRAWIPSGQEPLKGTLIVIPGRHGDGRGMAESSYWQEIARSVQFALVACQFADGEPFPYQNDPDGEVSQALNVAVARLAQEASRPELETAPLAFWGHSAGGCVSANYTEKFPKRVAAFVSLKCPRGPGDTVTAGREKVPTLVLSGKNDKPDWVKTTMDNVQKGKESKAVWTFALHPAEGHEQGKTPTLTATYLKTVIPARLGGDDSSSLAKLELSTGWLGNPETFEVFPSSDYSGKKKEAIWLPNEEVAREWSNYLKGS